MATVAEIHERHDAVREVERKLLDLQQVLFIFCIDLYQRINLYYSTAMQPRFQCQYG